MDTNRHYFFPWPKLKPINEVLSWRERILNGAFSDFYSLFSAYAIEGFATQFEDEEESEENSNVDFLFTKNKKDFKRLLFIYQSAFDTHPYFKILFSMFENANCNDLLHKNISSFYHVGHSLILIQRNLRNSIESLLDLYIMIAEVLYKREYPEFANGLNDNCMPVFSYYYEMLFGESLASNTLENDFSNTIYSHLKKDFNKNLLDKNIFKKDGVYSTLSKTASYLCSNKKSNNFIPAGKKFNVVKSYLEYEEKSSKKSIAVKAFNSFFKEKYSLNPNYDENFYDISQLNERKYIKSKDGQSFFEILKYDYHKDSNNSIHPNMFNDLYFRSEKITPLDKIDIDLNSGTILLKTNKWFKNFSMLEDLLYLELKIIFIAFYLIVLFLIDFNPDLSLKIENWPVIIHNHNTEFHDIQFVFPTPSEIDSFSRWSYKKNEEKNK